MTQNVGPELKLDDKIQKQIDEIMQESKKLVLKGGDEIHYKYKNIRQLDLGLTPDE